ncbi:MAG: TolC family protein [Bacteroidetes bacterium]|nr:TolC family protein [Bacteroidota bacterium]
MITALIRRSILAVLIGLIASETPALAQTAIDRYVKIGLENNLVLQQRNQDYESAVLALRESRSLFFPKVDLMGDYTTGDGGRNIGLPVGDLLNPVYSTLNQLTATNNFPQIQNEEINFFPANFYDLKVRTTVAFYNSDLIQNRKIKSGIAEMKASEIASYKKELVYQIKSAYFRYLSSLKVVNVYKNSIELAEENKRVNERLFANGKSLPAYVLKSESELASLQSLLAEADRNSDNARMYFNFLINASPDATIDTITAPAPETSYILDLLAAPADISKRSELQQLKEASAIQENFLKMKKRYWHPRLNGFADFGSQASNFEFNNDSRYYLVGVQLNIPVFSAGANRFRYKQADISLANRKLENTYITNQLQLAASQARNTLQAMYSKYNAALKQLEAAAAYQHLISRGYREGVNSFIESVDARNSYTNAALAVSVSQFQLMTAIASYEKELAQ